MRCKQYSTCKSIIQKHQIHRQHHLVQHVKHKAPKELPHLALVQVTTLWVSDFFIVEMLMSSNCFQWRRLRDIWSLGCKLVATRSSEKQMNHLYVQIRRKMCKTHCSINIYLYSSENPYVKIRFSLGDNHRIIPVKNQSARVKIAYFWN